MKKRNILILLSLVMILGVMAWFFGRNRDQTIRVTTDKSKKRDITETVAANGKIQPEIDVKISPDVSGEIIVLAVEEGDYVEKGDLLVKLKPDVYESALNRAEASLNNAKANLANSRARLTQVEAKFRQAKANFDRQKKLHEQGAISQADFETALSNYETAEADVKAAEETVRASQFSVQSAEASLKEAKDNLERTIIHAPRSGTISGLQVEEGERMVGTAQMAGTEMMHVSDLHRMEVDVEVNENDIVRVSLGDTADVEVDAYLDENFRGVVTEIANAATTSGQSVDQVTNFSVKIRLLRDPYEHLLVEEDSLGSPFRPGMSATVDIRTETVKQAVSLPIRAVTTREDTAGGKEEELQECVFRVRDNRALRTDVKTGIQDNKYIQVLEGIEAGEEVITGPYDAISRELADSSSVVVVEEKALFDKKSK